MRGKDVSRQNLVGSLAVCRTRVRLHHLLRQPEEDCRWRSKLTWVPERPRKLLPLVQCAMLPTTWTSKEPCILGIDEAGRGPCLGPMVFASAFCAKADHDRLLALGADDSKQLSEAKRDELRAVIVDSGFVGTDSIVLHAAELSSKMLRPSCYNLNSISHDTALSLVQRALDAGVNLTEVYVDTVGTAGKYADKFRDAFPSLEKVVVAPKADSIYKIVGAASIIAKTVRDQVVKSWVFEEETRAVEYAGKSGCCNGALSYATDYGSGYPSDPRTKQWLLAHVNMIFGFPSFVRFSWRTAKRLLEEQNAVEVLW
jgi:ribonuclease H2 subunit A